MQIIVAGVSPLAAALLRAAAAAATLRRGGDPTPANVDALIGLQGTVVSTFADGRGQVKLANGETWTSRLSAGSDEHALAEGEKVVVTRSTAPPPSSSPQSEPRDT